MGRLQQALINKDFARLWSGQAVSTVGDYAFDTTLVLWVATVLAKGKPWGPAAVSGIMLAAGLAVLTVGPLAGVFVDRWDHKKTMLRTEVVRAILCAALTALSFVPARDLPVPAWLTVIYVTVFGLNAMGRFFSPARFAIIADVVHGDADRTRAGGISQATSAMAAIVGPPLAAPLLFTVGIQWALLLNAASYVGSYLAIRSVTPAHMPEPAAAEQGGRKLSKEFADGIRHFVRSRILMVVLLVAIVAQLGTGAMNTLDVFFVTRNLHAESRLYGLLAMAIGTGAIAGGLLAGRVVARFGARTVTWVTVALAGALIMLFARQTWFPAGLALAVLFSLPIAMVNAAISPLMMGAAPPHLLGRVVSVFDPVNQLASMTSVVVAGWLASTALRNFGATVAGVHMGTFDVIFSAAGVLIVAAGIVAGVALPRERAGISEEPAAVPG